MHDFKYENKKTFYETNEKNMNNYHPRAHFIVIYSSSAVFTL